MISFDSKFPYTPTSIFTEMSLLANQEKAINLGQGFADYPMDPVLIRGVTSAMEAGYNQYAPSSGYLSLREILAEKTQNEQGVRYDPQTEITITPGPPMRFLAPLPHLCGQEMKYCISIRAMTAIIPPFWR